VSGAWPQVLVGVLLTQKIGEKTMTRLYKKNLYRPVPPDAEIVKVAGGHSYAVWKVRGRKRTAKYVETANGPRVIEESRYYIARYTDATGRTCERSTRCRDLQNAQHLLAKWQQDEEKVAAGVVSREELEMGQRSQEPIKTYLPDFEQAMKIASTCPKHIKGTITRIRKVANECGFSRVIDLNAAALDKWLTDQQAKGMAAATRNGYRTSMITFANWAVINSILNFNPIAKTHVANADLDRRHERRALTREEVDRLLQATEERPLHDKMLVIRGKNKGQHAGEVDELVRKNAIRDGREHRLIYTTLI